LKLIIEIFTQINPLSFMPVYVSCIHAETSLRLNPYRRTGSRFAPRPFRGLLPCALRAGCKQPAPTR